jgi:hypothetical protein
MRRAIEIKMIDRTTKILEISKATSLKCDMGMLHLDKLKDDTWRLLFSNDIIKNFQDIESFNIIREN